MEDSISNESKFSSPVYSKPVTDTSILKPSILLRFVAMNNALGNTSVDIGGSSSFHGESQSVALRSSIMHHVWYEIIRIVQNNKEDEIYIYVCVSDMNDENSKPCRISCVYANGDILKWGMWFAELLNALPFQYETVSQLYNNQLIEARVEEGFLPELDPNKSAPKYLQEVEASLLQCGAFSNEAVEKHYELCTYKI